MALGTLDRTPPPFFRQGLPALTKLLLCAALAVFLMVADRRFAVVQPMRAALATLLLPVAEALDAPWQVAGNAADYLRGLQAAQAAEHAARLALVQQAAEMARAQELNAENNRLRALLALQPATPVSTLAAQVLYEAPDVFSRKLVLNRGSRQDVQLGAPVIDERGVLGQITRVYPLSSEATLLVDPNAAIAVINTRTQQRNVAYGNWPTAAMLLRFVAANADVQVGDRLTTSGIDGLFPPGLAVATVAQVERQADTGFARIVLTPAAAPDAVRHVLVLQPLSALLPPAAASAPASAPQERP